MGFGKDGKGVIIRESREQALGILADKTVIFIGTKLATLDDFRMLKTEVNAFLDGGTAGDVGGLLIGLADGDLSTSEIAAGMVVNAPLGPNDVVGGNVAMRPSWIIGALVADGSGTQGHFRGEGNSPNIKFNPRWTFAQTKAWNFFIYNNTGHALTTGAVVELLTKDFGVWVR